MPFIPTPHVVSVVLKGHDDDGEVRNVFNWFHPVEGMTVADVIALVQWFYTTIWPKIQPILSSAYRLDSIAARDMSSASGANYEEFFTPQGGTAGGEVYAGNVCLRVSTSTALAARSGHGRNFYSPLTESTINNGRPSPAVIALGTTLLNSLINIAPLPGLKFCVWSRKFHTYNLVNGGRINSDPGSQRDRLPGRGA